MLSFDGVGCRSELKVRWQHDPSLSSKARSRRYKIKARLVGPEDVELFFDVGEDGENWKLEGRKPEKGPGTGLRPATTCEEVHNANREIGAPRWYNPQALILEPSQWRRVL